MTKHLHRTFATTESSSVRSSRGCGQKPSGAPGRRCPALLACRGRTSHVTVAVGRILATPSSREFCVALVVSLSVCSVVGASTSSLHWVSAELLATRYAIVETHIWHVPSIPDAKPMDLAYAEEDKLVVVRNPDRPDRTYRAFVLDSEGNDIGDWAAPPDSSRWVPIAVASRVGESVFLGVGDAPAHEFSPSGVYLSDRLIRASGVSSWPRRLRSASAGSLYGVDGLIFGPWIVHRWLPDGDYAGAWRQGDPGKPGVSKLLEVAVRSDGDILLLSGDGRIHVASPFGRADGSFGILWPAALGPPEEEEHDEVISEGFAADWETSELLFYDDVQRGKASHVIRTNEEGEFRSAVQLWRFRNSRPVRSVSPAIRSDGFALAWTPTSRVSISNPSLGITQFRADGSLSAVTRMMETTTGSILEASEEWGRVRLGDAGPQPVLLSPTSGMLGRLDGEHLDQQHAAIPFAMDLSSSEVEGAIVRGWDGIDGRVARYDTDGTLLWDVRCECSLATGLSHDAEQVYVGDVTSGVISRFAMLDGSRLDSVDHAPSVRTSLVDLAALGAGRLALLEMGGQIRVFDYDDPDIDETWSVRSASEPVAIGGGGERVAVLFADATVEVWSAEGLFIDSWSVERDGVEDPSDIAMNAADRSVMVVGEAGVVGRYAPEEREPVLDDLVSEPGDGDCELEGFAAAEPGRVSPNDIVDVTITVRGVCPEPATAADVIIAWTPSRSFWYHYGFERAREAVDQLVRMLEWSGVRVEVVIAEPSGVGGATLFPFETPTDDAINLIATYHRTDFETYLDWHAGESEWPDLVEFGSERLSEASRPEAERYIVLVGQPLATTSAASAETFIRGGGRILQLELPTYIADHSLDSILSEPQQRLFVAHAGDVARIARRIVSRFQTPVLRNPQLVVKESALSRYQTLSAEPAAIEEPGRIGWRLEPIEEGQAVSFKIRPRGFGELPAFESAILYVTEPNGKRRAFEIAPASYTVIEATPDPSGTDPVGPYQVYLPSSSNSE